ncbi:hypothetical protein QBC46DRAFT_390173 [Diplogelasinospora grovesii]|uniref:Biotrophy-associated secreted protein 2 n=1 Tax=Diplogelasinospora grovesii TaxID=303347 RepID=A0AAN6S3B7_9PEZI|nr:hypothetical protein QBC46DRAFT_390173 [Diplogelasinospora grovesii]
MVQISTFIGTLALAIASVQAMPNLVPRGLPDPAGAANQGNGAGKQFIGGQCNSAADCASTCCATLPQAAGTIGVCSGPGAQREAGKQGCGFVAGGASTGGSNASATSAGQAAAATTAAAAAGGAAKVVPSTLVPDPAGAKNVGNGKGQQFITGECTSDADCASTCCALVNNGTATFGICSGVGANTQNGKQGCGFPQGGQRLSLTKQPNVAAWRTS